MTSTPTLFDLHRATLDGALAAIRARDYWSAYAEAPSEKHYGAGARQAGEDAFERLRGQTFALDLPGAGPDIGDERSPFGLALDIRYPARTPATLIGAASRALQTWKAVPPARRVGIALEALARLNRRSFEIAYACMHTTGNSFMMAFQAGGPHAQERALEAVAYAWREMASLPASVEWTKPQGKGEPLRLHKEFRIVPRGVAVVIGCSTFPTWNSYPGLFASLVTGNPVIVKPHPAAVLPLAITVRVLRELLVEQGLDPDIVTLLVDSADAPRTRELVSDPAVRLVDFTGGSTFGNWLEQSLPHAHVFTEKAGVNVALIASTANYKGLLRNLATTLSLYSGQMCTTPQNIFVPRDGFASDLGPISLARFQSDLAAELERLTGTPEQAVELLGAIQSPATLARIDAAAARAKVLAPSRALEHPRFPAATVRTPLLLAADAAADTALIGQELFGPISFVVAADSAVAALTQASAMTRQHGAITWLVHATDEAFIARAADAAAEVGVHVAFNLTGPILVNQSAAYSDFHVSGYNAAGNAALCDPAFVLPRFRVLQIRRHDDAPAQVPKESPAPERLAQREPS